jgi:hypothetical protein
MAEETERHEPETHHEAPKKDDDKEKLGDPKKGLGAELKKRPWLWLVITVGVGILGWVVYEKLSGSSTAATTTEPTPTVTGDDGGGGATGGGGGDQSDQDEEDQELAEELQSLEGQVGALGDEISSLYSTPPPGGTSSSLPSTQPSGPMTYEGIPITAQDVTLAETYGGSPALQAAATGGTQAQQIAALSSINQPTATALGASGTAAALTAALKSLGTSAAAAVTGKTTTTTKTTAVPLVSTPTASQTAALVASANGQLENATKTQAKVESSVPKIATTKTAAGSKISQG